MCYIGGHNETIVTLNETGKVASMELGIPLRVVEVVLEPKPAEVPGKVPVEPNPARVPEKVDAPV